MQNRNLYKKEYWEKTKDFTNKKRRDKLQILKQDEDAYKKYLENKSRKNKQQWKKKQQEKPDYADKELNRQLLKAQSLLNKEFKKLCGKSEVKKGKLFYSEKYKHDRINDLQFRLKDNMRARIRKALKHQSAKKNKSTFDLIGCTGFELTQYLLSLGYNKDTDHVDHIIPISRFDLSNPDHQLISCHYLNLQPLYYIDNCSKHNSLPYNWQDKIIQICEVRNINPEPIIDYIQVGVQC